MAPGPRTGQSNPRGQHRWPRTLIILLALMALSAVGYLVAGLIQPDRFADVSHCVSQDASGIFNSCDEDVVVTLCWTETDGKCLRETLEPGQFFVAENGRVTDPILGQSFACKVPFIPTIGADPNNATLPQNTCRQAD